MKLVLLGYMGSGKSSVGQRLADVLNYPFKDLDSEIEKREGQQIPSLFDDKGEIYFRRKESEVLAELLADEEKVVLALGGGTPCYANNMDLILEQDGTQAVYLNASLDSLVNRLFEDRHTRPLISHLEDQESLKDFVRKHLFERTHHYLRADHVVDVSNIEIREVVEEIILKLF